MLAPPIVLQQCIMLFVSSVCTPCLYPPVWRGVNFALLLEFVSFELGMCVSQLVLTLVAQYVVFSLFHYITLHLHLVISKTLLSRDAQGRELLSYKQ